MTNSLPHTDAATLRARDGAALRVSETSEVTTCHVFAQPLKEGRWLLIRPGTSGMLLTSEAGLRAFHMFRTGATVAAVKNDLATSAPVPAAAIDLGEFISAIAGAGMIKSVDGVRVRVPRVRWARLCRHYFQIAIYPTVFAVLNRLPIALRERLLYYVHWQLQGRVDDPAETAAVRDNLARLFPSMTPGTLDDVALEFRRQRVRQTVDFLTTDQSPASVSRWVDTFLDADMVGLDRFRQAVSAGAGAIVVSFHYGAYWLLPAVLLKLGVSVHVLVGSRPRRPVIEFADADGRKSVLTFHDRSLSGLAELSRAAAAGGVIVVFADTHGIGDSNRQRFVHGTWGKSRYAETEIDVLGHNFPVEAGLGWLHQQLRSPVIPAILHPLDNSWKVRLEFGHAESRSEALMIRSVYQQMARWLECRPAPWAYLPSFPSHHRR